MVTSTQPTLIILGGLPGSGKTTLARQLCMAIGAFHVRVDSIEQAMRARLDDEVELYDEGYRVGYALASDNLRLGGIVVADSVNPVEESRRCWREAATSVPVAFVEVEIRCSDEAEHERRVRTRGSDIPGMVVPSWQGVRDREWEPWESATVRIDTAGRGIEASADELIARLPR